MLPTLPQYYTSIQVQQYRTATRSHPSCPTPADQPGTSYPSSVLQRQHAFYWSMLCCLYGRNSAHLRRGCVLFGILIMIHGAISIIFGFLFTLGSISKAASGSEEFYVLVIAPLSALFLPEVNEVFPTVLSFLYPLAVDICGGGLLILGAIFLKEMLCYASIVTFAVGLIGNLLNTIVILLASFVVVTFSVGDSSTRIYYVYASVFRFGACVYLTYCIVGALALRDQIQNGEYAKGVVHPLPSSAAAPTPISQSMVTQTGTNDEAIVVYKSGDI